MPTRIFQFGNLHHLFAPRKPRHPLVRVAAGLAGLAILAVLIFFSVFVGAAMILGGVAWKLLSKSNRRAPQHARVVEAEYHVVRKPALPLSH
ncbi:hypothetical protein [Xanthomonas campestris]|uniref:hypothetical protein n=1 Tax=Xanthomonas campestris TaxID=339 RepID=UPI00021AFB4A|nr:hypothetical protein [Xanthomonas campestris]AEL08354.1 conserved hypothetical protein [Xanthomonas campestris pv. raphani 756C]MCC5062960.1 hypothetical protein [Xanthomonas campestris pv. raphani]MEA9657604.1 hypothetical protein [Xanthomonas campestris pv. raphani]MEA9705195.1 hypothetical protein [Xanthomonas campestris pv. raphani]MEA9753702.1 hypothetical protein [Xanthomonas campestris pv. raphani]